jgi:hypothetical protein
MNLAGVLLGACDHLVGVGSGEHDAAWALDHSI